MKLKLENPGRHKGKEGTISLAFCTSVYKMSTLIQLVLAVFSEIYPNAVVYKLQF